MATSYKNQLAPWSSQICRHYLYWPWQLISANTDHKEVGSLFWWLFSEASLYFCFISISEAEWDDSLPAFFTREKACLPSNTSYNRNNGYYSLKFPFNISDDAEANSAGTMMCGRVGLWLLTRVFCQTIFLPFRDASPCLTPLSMSSSTSFARKYHYHNTDSQYHKGSIIPFASACT